ncbi:MAG: type II CAAX endopeptidase family protein [Clostridia bacterium]|jgi:hypothetical protein|nr:CPBP family intramembrane metalloprotease [Clostridia bacterium]
MFKNEIKTNQLIRASFVYFIILVFFVLLRLSVSLGFLVWLDDNTLDIVYTLITQIGIMLFIPIFFVNKIKKQKTINTLKNDFGFKKIKFESILVSVLIGGLAFLLNIAVASFFSGILQLFGYTPPTSSSGDSVTTWSAFIVAIIFTGLLPAICEEITHRGLLLNGLKQLGVKRAIIFSSILFGLIHLNVMQTFYAIVMGALMATTVVISGSIIPAIIIHFMNNSINVYLSFAKVKGFLGADFYSSIESFVSSYGVITAFLFIGILLLGIVLTIWGLIITLKNLQRHTIANENIKNDILINQDNNDIQNSQNYNESEKIAKLRKIFIYSPTSLFSYTRKPRFFDKLFPPAFEECYTVNTKEKFFLYSSLFLGGIITIFTYIWGVM